MTNKHTSSDDELEDLIMRMKDCISHEDKHNQHFTDRCITKVQFKQQMRAYVKTHYIKKADIVEVIVNSDKLYTNEHDRKIANHYKNELLESLNLEGEE